LLRPFTRQTRVGVHAHDVRGVPALITAVGRSRCFTIRDANERRKGYNDNQPDQPMPDHFSMYLFVFPGCSQVGNYIELQI
jgi:hypothetical protein